MTTRAQLVEQLLKFPAPDRAEAARALLESLDRGDEADDVTTAWNDEITSRVQQIENGAIPLEDGETVMRQLRERYVVEDDVRIVAVAHAKLKPGYWRQRVRDRF